MRRGSSARLRPLLLVLLKLLALALLLQPSPGGAASSAPPAPCNLTIQKIESNVIHLMWVLSKDPPSHDDIIHENNDRSHRSIRKHSNQLNVFLNDDRKKKRRRDAGSDTEKNASNGTSTIKSDTNINNGSLSDSGSLNFRLFYKRGPEGDKPWVNPEDLSWPVIYKDLTLKSKIESPKHFTYNLTKLTPFTNYEIWVTAYYSFLNGSNSSLTEPSPKVHSITDVSPPSEPDIKELYCASPGKMFIQWLKPKDYVKSLDIYTIGIKSNEVIRGNQVVIINTTADHIETAVILPVESYNNVTYEVEMYASTLSVYSNEYKNGTKTKPHSVFMTVNCTSDLGADEIESPVNEIELPASMVGYVFLALIVTIVILLFLVLILYRWGCTNTLKKCFPMTCHLLERGAGAGGNDGCSEGGLLSKPEMSANCSKKTVTSPTHTIIYWGPPDNTICLDAAREQLWDPFHPPVSAEKFLSHTAALHADSAIGFSKEYDLIQTKSSSLGYSSFHSQHPDNRHKNRYLNITAYDHSRVCLLPSSSCNCEPGREHRKSCISKTNSQSSEVPVNCDYVNANFIDGVVSEINPDLSKFIVDQNNKRKAFQKKKNEMSDVSNVVTQPTSELWITLDESHNPHNHVQACSKTFTNDNVDMNAGIAESKYPFSNTNMQDSINTMKNKLSLDLEKKDEKKILSPGSEILASTCRLSINLDRKDEKQEDVKSEKSAKEVKNKKRSTSADTRDIIIDKKSSSRGHSKNSSVVVTGNDSSPSNNPPKIEGAFLNIEFSGIVDSERELQKARELERLKEASKVPEAPEETLDDLEDLYVQIDNESYRVNSSWLLDRRRYIGTQGPTPGTLTAFWRMVWDHKVVVIVMITNLVERGKRKCDMYWPKEGSETHGLFQVNTLREEVMATYTVRTFSIKNIKTGESRSVFQYHYTVWPDHGTPEHPLAVLRFREAARKAAHPQAGAILVHCSAGVGRTGTYIVLDAMLNYLRLTGSLNVYGFLCHIRSQRNFLVQTEEQYIFIHDALLEAIQSGDTEVLSENAKTYLRKLLEPFPEDFLRDSIIESKFGLYGAPIKENHIEPVFETVGEECDFTMWSNVDDVRYSGEKTLDECRNDIVSVALREALELNSNINGNCENQNNVDLLQNQPDIASLLNGVNKDNAQENSTNHSNLDENISDIKFNKMESNDISPELIIDDVKEDQKIIDFEDGIIYNKNLINKKDIMACEKNPETSSINSIILGRSDHSTSYEKLNGVCAKVSEESKASSMSNEEVELSSNDNNSNGAAANGIKNIERISGAPFSGDNSNTITSSISSDTNNAVNFKDKTSNYSPSQMANNQDGSERCRKGKSSKIEDNYEQLSGSGRPGGLGSTSSDCFAGAHQFSCQKKDFGGKKPRNLLEHQFKLITSFEPSKFHIVNACKQVNSGKNRRGAVLPIESGRVHLIPKPGIDGSDYINATWLQGHRALREYVVTQHPLNNTIADFYRLLWDHSCQILVILTNHGEDPECKPFWPTEKNPELTTLSYKVNYISEEKYVAKRITSCDPQTRKGIHRLLDDDSSQDSSPQSPSSISSNKAFSPKQSKETQRTSPISLYERDKSISNTKEFLDNDGIGNNGEKSETGFYRRQSSTDNQDEERLIPKSEDAPSFECSDVIDELKKLHNETKSEGYNFDKAELRSETMSNGENKDSKSSKLSPKKCISNGEPFSSNDDSSKKSQKSPSKLSLKSLKLSSPVLKSPTKFKFEGFGLKNTMNNSKGEESQCRKSPVTVTDTATFDPKFAMIPLIHMSQLREGSEEIGMDCVIKTTNIVMNSINDDYELKIKLIECPKWLAHLDYDENSDTDDDSDDDEYEMEVKDLDYVIDERLKAFKGVFGLTEYVTKCQDEHKNSPVVVVDKLGGARAVAFCTLGSSLRKKSRDLYTLAKLHHGRRAGAWRRPADIRALYEALAAYEHPPPSASTPTKL